MVDMRDEIRQASLFSKVMDRLDQLEAKLDILEQEDILNRISSLEYSVETIQNRVSSLPHEEYWD